MTIPCKLQVAEACAAAATQEVEDLRKQLHQTGAIAIAPVCSCIADIPFHVMILLLPWFVCWFSRALRAA